MLVVVLLSWGESMEGEEWQWGVLWKDFSLMGQRGCGEGSGGGGVGGD